MSGTCTANRKNANIRNRAVSTKSMMRGRGKNHFCVQHDLSLHSDGNNVEYNYVNMQISCTKIRMDVNKLLESNDQKL